MKRHGPPLAILILALGLRFWNLQYGLPWILHPDEPTILGPALRIANVADFDPDPRFYNYPSLQIYVLSTCLYVEGAFSPGGSWARPALPDLIGAVRLGRWVTAMFGLATVAVLYAIASRHLSRRTALAAGLFLAVAPLHALDSHYTNVDVPMAFWILLACYFALEYAREGGPWRFLLAACCVGFAGATKYTALASIPLLPAAVLLGPIPKGGALARSRRIAAGLGVCALAFIACAPFTVLRFNEAFGAMRFEQAHVQRGHWGFDLNPGGWINHRFVYQLAAGLPFVLGLPLYLAALGGLARMIRRPGRTWWILAAASLPLFAVVASSRVVFPRYLIPLLPFLVILAAALFADLTADERRKPVRIGAFLVASAIALYTAALTTSQVRILEPQNATLASRWIESNVPRGSRIAVATYVWTLSIPAEEYRLGLFDVNRALAGDELPEWLAMSGWYETSLERGNLRDGEIGRYIKSLAASERAPYEVAARFESRYLNEDFYGMLDPYFKNQFESPDFTIYRRRSR